MLNRVLAGALVGALPGLLLLLMLLASPNGSASTRILPGVLLVAIGGYVGALYGASMRR